MGAVLDGSYSYGNCDVGGPAASRGNCGRGSKIPVHSALFSGTLK